MSESTANGILMLLIQRAVPELSDQEHWLNNGVLRFATALTGLGLINIFSSCSMASRLRRPEASVGQCTDRQGRCDIYTYTYIHIHIYIYIYMEVK